MCPWGNVALVPRPHVVDAGTAADEGPQRCHRTGQRPAVAGVGSSATPQRAGWLPAGTGGGGDRDAQANRQAGALDAVDPQTGVPLVERLGGLDRELAKLEERHTLRPLLQTLPDRERTVVVLRFFGEMTQTEIAQRLGISQMHVSRLLTRSLQQLRAQHAGGGTDD